MKNPAIASARREYMRNLSRKRRAINPAIVEREAARMRALRSDAEYVNAERRLERARYAENPTPALDRSRAYRKQNPGLFAAYSRNRRAAEAGADGSHSWSDVELALTLQDHRCAHCRISLVGGFHVDHIIPISRGGSNWPDNIQCLCGPCNSKKSNLLPHELALRPDWMAASNSNSEIVHAA